MIKYQKGNKKSIINIKVSGVKKLNNSSNGNIKETLQQRLRMQGGYMLLALILFGVDG